MPCCSVYYNHLKPIKKTGQFSDRRDFFRWFYPIFGIPLAPRAANGQPLADPVAGGNAEKQGVQPWEREPRQVRPGGRRSQPKPVTIWGRKRGWPECSARSGSDIFATGDTDLAGPRRRRAAGGSAECGGSREEDCDPKRTCNRPTTGCRPASNTIGWPAAALSVREPA